MYNLRNGMIFITNYANERINMININGDSSIQLFFHICKHHTKSCILNIVLKNDIGFILP